MPKLEMTYAEWADIGKTFDLIDGVVNHLSSKRRSVPVTSKLDRGYGKYKVGSDEYNLLTSHFYQKCGDELYIEIFLVGLDESKVPECMAQDLGDNYTIVPGYVYSRVVKQNPAYTYHLVFVRYRQYDQIYEMQQQIESLQRQVESLREEIKQQPVSACLTALERTYLRSDFNPTESAEEPTSEDDYPCHPH
jgi:hypothetical protein